MRVSHADRGTQGIEDSLKSLLDAQMLLGKEVVRLLGNASSAVMANSGYMTMPRTECGCEIPEPCWMPLSLGETCCRLAPGDSGTVCLVVTNGDFRPHSYQFAATGKSAAHVSFSASSATLGPKERMAVTATFTMPRDSRLAEGCDCIDHEALLWVRGCRNHYLRWNVDEVCRGERCCHEIEVADDPDYVLHWYDHFYVARPCFGAATAPGAIGGVK